MTKMRRAAATGAALAALCVAAAPGDALAASEACTAPTAAGIDGYVLNTYMRLTAQRDPADSKKTWICYRANDIRFGDVGGRVDVTDATVSPTLPSADGQADACTTSASNTFPGPRPLVDARVGDPGDPTYTPLLVDAYLASNQLWGCLRAGAVNARVKVSTSGIAAPVVNPFVADAPGLPLPAQKQGPIGSASNKCLENFWHVRDVNMRINDSHIWVYHWPESPTQQAICFRVERAGQQPIGYRVVLDTTNVRPVVEASEDTTPCTETIVQVNQPIQARLSRSEDGPGPASICFEAAGVKHRITAGTTGDPTQPLIRLHKDADSV